jgi:hypothetical protein
MLEVQGLNPATVNAAAARAALEQDLTPEQQAVVDSEAERLFKEVCFVNMCLTTEMLLFTDVQLYVSRSATHPGAVALCAAALQQHT